RDCQLNCGGYFLKPAHVQNFICPFGATYDNNECYVYAIVGFEDASNLTLVRGKFILWGLYPKQVFIASSGYMKQSPSSEGNGEFYEMKFNDKIRCFKAPCPFMWEICTLNYKPFTEMRIDAAFASPEDEGLVRNGMMVEANVTASEVFVFNV